jgi:hypothetical protein
MRSSESDPLVSAEYRASATERPPSALDAAILEKAKTAVGDTGLQGFTASWFRPLAFVATFALSLALVLELRRAPEFESVTDPKTESGSRKLLRTTPTGVEDRLATELPGVENAPARIERPDAGSNSIAREPQPPSVSTETLNLNDDSGRVRPGKMPALIGDIETRQEPFSATAPISDGGATAETADNGSKRNLEQESITETSMQSPDQTRTAEKLRSQDVAAFRASSVASDSAAGSCPEDQMTEPLRWWQCITDLKEAGRHDEAKVELALFNASYPEFEPPDTP